MSTFSEQFISNIYSPGQVPDEFWTRKPETHTVDPETLKRHMEYIKGIEQDEIDLSISLGNEHDKDIIYYGFLTKVDVIHLISTCKNLKFDIFVPKKTWIRPHNLTLFASVLLHELKEDDPIRLWTKEKYNILNPMFDIDQVIYELGDCENEQGIIRGAFCEGDLNDKDISTSV